MNEIHMKKGKRWIRMVVEDELFHLLSTKGFIRYYNCVWSFKPTESFNIDFYNYNEFINQLMEKNNDI
jgi:hypothetical protein